MLIKSLAIKNFRCIKDLQIELSELTAFVGRNGSGKSTTLQALNIFYNIKAPISEEDYFNKNTANPIEITVEYRNLSDLEKAEFKRHVKDDTFAVTKKIEFNNGSNSQKYFASTKQIPQIARIREAGGITGKRNAWNKLIDDGELPELGPRSKQGDDPLELMDNYEKAHPELAEWVPEPVQFLGPPNIGGGSLDNYTKFVYVPAVRDASDDTNDKKGSPLYQLLDFIVMRRFQARTEVRQLKEEFSGRLKGLYDREKLTEFGELANEISETLRLYVPNAELDLLVSEPKLPEIPSPSTIANLIEDEYAGSIDRKGHGLQRALIFSILQHLAVAKPFEVVTEDGDNGAEVTGTEDKPDTVEPVGQALIIAIEEPELYQHPLRARHFAQTLLKMSKESALGPGGQNQILYCTHSPYFVDLERFDQLRIIRKYKQYAVEPPCTNVASFTLLQASQEMARLTGLPETRFTAESFKAHAHPVMTQSVNEGFFADAVVLVEGDTEVAMLLAVSDRLDSNWLSKGIAVVSVEGKSKIGRAAVVFKGLGIPTYIVFDGDKSLQGKRDKEKQASEANRLLLKLSGAEEVDFPDSIADADYACFADNFESYCRETIGEDDYGVFIEQAANSHGYTKPTQGIKNYDVVVDLVKLVYDNDYTLPLVEQIIEKIDQKLPAPSLEPAGS